PLFPYTTLFRSVAACDRPIGDLTLARDLRWRQHGGPGNRTCGTGEDGTGSLGFDPRASGGLPQPPALGHATVRDARARPASVAERQSRVAVPYRPTGA